MMRYHEQLVKAGGDSKGKLTTKEAPDVAVLFANWEESISTEDCPLIVNPPAVLPALSVNRLPRICITESKIPMASALTCAI